MIPGHASVLNALLATIRASHVLTLYRRVDWLCIQNSGTNIWWLNLSERLTRNIFDCDQSNYSSRIILTHIPAKIAYSLFRASGLVNPFPARLTKDLWGVSYTSRVIAIFVPNIVAITTGVGRARICLTSVFLESSHMHTLPFCGVPTPITFPCSFQFEFPFSWESRGRSQGIPWKLLEYRRPGITINKRAPVESDSLRSYHQHDVHNN